jgi:lactoylglutathione lyase
MPHKIYDFAVNQDCHGSGKCVSVAPQHFALDPVDGQARVILQPDAEAEQEACFRAQRICPVNAIEAVQRGREPQIEDGLEVVELNAGEPVEALRIDHVNMFVRNLEESVEFYARVFGVTIKERGVGKGKIRWAILGIHERFYFCMYELVNSEFEPDTLHINHIGLYVSDLDETIRRLHGLGLKLEYGDKPVVWERSRSAYIRDPNGYAIELTERFGGGLN